MRILQSDVSYFWWIRKKIYWKRKSFNKILQVILSCCLLPFWMYAMFWILLRQHVHLFGKCFLFLTFQLFRVSGSSLPVLKFWLMLVLALELSVLYQYRAYRPVHTVSVLKWNKSIIVPFRLLFFLVLPCFVRFAMFRLIPPYFVWNSKIRPVQFFWVFIAKCCNGTNSAQCSSLCSVRLPLTLVFLNRNTL